MTKSLAKRNILSIVVIVFQRTASSHGLYKFCFDEIFALKLRYKSSSSDHGRELSSSPLFFSPCFDIISSLFDSQPRYKQCNVYMLWFLDKSGSHSPIQSCGQCILLSSTVDIHLF